MQVQQRDESKERTDQIEQQKKLDRPGPTDQAKERPDRTKEIEEAKKKGGGAL